MPVTRTFPTDRSDQHRHRHEHFVLRTTLDIRPTGVSRNFQPIGPEKTRLPFESAGYSYVDQPAYDEGHAAQRRYDAVVRAISNRAQPMDIEVTTEEGVVDPLGADTIFVFQFTVEHDWSWTPDELQRTLTGVEGFTRTNFRVEKASS